ncbi:helix-turn-helix domain-containing protein [Ligilactobacillus animalis]|uniref:helix-turn-helix domain-containing protein n=1 Tax=Ligilactobacillus animalis TaxID=1605 RepID=UPI00242F8ED2|nr:helix-turn-helix transcriptional regulator [Ligilactobacillus animalis]
MTLEAARVNAQLTQKEAAKKLGIHFQTLSKYENDSSNIPFSLLENASELYGIPLSFIFLGKKYENIHTRKGE